MILSGCERFNPDQTETSPLRKKDSSPSKSSQGDLDKILIPPSNQVSSLSELSPTKVGLLKKIDSSSPIHEINPITISPKRKHKLRLMSTKSLSEGEDDD